MTAIEEGALFAGRYRIQHKLGQGGMGAVFAVLHEVTRQRFALKVILGNNDDPGAVARFRREAEVAGSLATRHTVQVLDAGVSDGVPYLVMELLHGRDLAQLLLHVGPLEPTLAARLVAQAARGLSKAHAAGVVHRDIKTANLFVAESDEGDPLVKVLDFGIAKLRRDPGEGPEAHALTRTGAMMGSPLYMSPEQAMGDRGIDAKADLWSLGVTLYELLVGTTPFHAHGTIGRLIIAICHEPIAPIREVAAWVPAPLAAVVDQLLQRDKAARPRDAEEVRAALVAFAGKESIALGELAPSVARAEGAPTESQRRAPAVHDSGAYAPTLTPVDWSPPTAGNAGAAISGGVTQPLPAPAPARAADHGAAPDVASAPRVSLVLVLGGAALLALGAATFLATRAPADRSVGGPSGGDQAASAAAALTAPAVLSEIGTASFAPPASVPSAAVPAPPGPPPPVASSARAAVPRPRPADPPAAGPARTVPKPADPPSEPPAKKPPAPASLDATKTFE